MVTSPSAKIETSPQSPPNTVVVVGGGVAGIAASLALAKSGAHVTLLESKSRLGGRAGSFATMTQDGAEEIVDYCQHVGMGCCHNLKRLISWLGQEEAWTVHPQLHFYGPQGDYRRLSALPLVPAPLHISHWLWSWPGLRFLDRLAIARGITALWRLRLRDPLDDVSAYDWLIEHGQTHTAIKHFWSTIVVSALGEDIHQVSLAAVCKVLQDGFLGSRDAFHLLVPSRPLNQLFNIDAHDVLRRLGVDVRLSAAVRQIDVQDQQIEINTNQICQFADAVILAIPWFQFSKLTILSKGNLSPSIAAGCQQLRSSPITGIHTWWDRPWLNSSHAAIVGRLCQWVFPKPTEIKPADTRTSTADSRGASSEYYYQIVISASRDFASDRSQDAGIRVHQDLSLVFPEVRTARLLKYQVVTDPNSVFSVSTGGLQFRPTMRTHLPNVLLAGDWTRTGWPATMEGAVLSGFRAAETMLNCRVP